MDGSRDAVNRAIDAYWRQYRRRAARSAEAVNQKFAQATRTALAGGKRIRASIVLSVASSVSSARGGAPCPGGGNGSGGGAPGSGGFPTGAMDAAIGLEFIHGASLVIDDLPVFDNDLVRRGKPSIHAKYGTQMAMLVGGGMMSAGFAMLAIGGSDAWHARRVRDGADAGPRDAHIALLHEASRAVEVASSGQLEELRQEVTGLADLGLSSEDRLIRIARAKTGALFVLAMVAGFATGTGSAPTADETVLLHDAGNAIGVMWQIADDAADIGEDDPDSNLILKHGILVALRRFTEASRTLHAALGSLHLRCPFFTKLQQCLSGKLLAVPA